MPSSETPVGSDTRFPPNRTTSSESRFESFERKVLEPTYDVLEIAALAMAKTIRTAHAWTIARPVPSERRMRSEYASRFSPEGGMETFRTSFMDQSVTQRLRSLFQPDTPTEYGNFVKERPAPHQAAHTCRTAGIRMNEAAGAARNRLEEALLSDSPEADLEEVYQSLKREAEKIRKGLTDR